MAQDARAAVAPAVARAALACFAELGLAAVLSTRIAFDTVALLAELALTASTTRAVAAVCSARFVAALGNAAGRVHAASAVALTVCRAAGASLVRIANAVTAKLLRFTHAGSADIAELTASALD